MFSQNSYNLTLYVMCTADKDSNYLFRLYRFSICLFQRCISEKTTLTEIVYNFTESFSHVYPNKKAIIIQRSKYCEY